MYWCLVVILQLSLFFPTPQAPFGDPQVEPKGHFILGPISRHQPQVIRLHAVVTKVEGFPKACKGDFSRKGMKSCTTDRYVTICTFCGTRSRWLKYSMMSRTLQVE